MGFGGGNWFGMDDVSLGQGMFMMDEERKQAINQIIMTAREYPFEERREVVEKMAREFGIERFSEEEFQRIRTFTSSDY